MHVRPNKFLLAWLTPSRTLSVSGLAWRAFWAIMFVGHLPAMVNLCVDPFATSPARAAILIVSQIVFLLKVLDVSALRLNLTRRQTIAMTVVVIFMHAGVVDRMSPHDVDPPAVGPAIVLTIGTLAILGVHDRLRLRTLGRLLAALLALPPRVRPVFAWLRAAEFRPSPALARLRPCRAHRAPPFRS